MIIKREKPKSFLPIHITITNAQEEAFLKYILSRFARGMEEYKYPDIDPGAKAWGEDLLNEIEGSE